MDLNTLSIGLLFFFARVMDVSIATLRTIVLVQGRTTLSFFLGFVEMIIWLLVVSAVINTIKDTPILIFFYAFGFAVGNVTGIIIEKKLALGMIILRVISKNEGQQLADQIKQKGQPVTAHIGQGMTWPILELYIVCKRRNLKSLLTLVKQIDPKAFYFTEVAGEAQKIRPSISQPITGWRSMIDKWKKLKIRKLNKTLQY